MYFYKKSVDKYSFMYYNIIVNKKYIKTEDTYYVSRNRKKFKAVRG